ncbi:TetR/AcrR family transcriptional regulator [Microcella humidisoli]|uniref:TetR/AcrR family transcriptional regulator n=1 Tax=Microcella humidisoli TaxID=2963406 RepID=A0ABY5FW14_9MICO|nr:TetR/AcrR family transcriptional regulator [Microcella humidisoli]UTT62132.1 TetR/AcrR family transcriptional regulator [Microcella humidisoli]
MPERQTPGSTRDRILSAAAAMLADDPAATLSVRAVAQRAGVSMGSLRHFFPTQRDLIDAVVAAIAAIQPTDELESALHDTTRPAVDRLVDLLRGTLRDALADESARARLRSALAAPSSIPTDEQAAPTLALERLALRQIAGWVTTLHAETDDDDASTLLFDADAGARFLGTVLTGLVTEQALPGALSRAAFHDGTLRIAATAVLSTRG